MGSLANVFANGFENLQVYPFLSLDGVFNVLLSYVGGGVLFDEQYIYFEGSGNCGLEGRFFLHHLLEGFLPAHLHVRDMNVEVTEDFKLLMHRGGTVRGAVQLGFGQNLVPPIFFLLLLQRMRRPRR